MQARRLYRRELAQLHHRAWSDLARAAAPALLGELRRAGLDRGLIVDLGCGGGVWLRAAQRAGFAAVGVDASAAMLALARREAPGAALVLGSIHRVAIPRCIAVTALGEPLSYLEPGASSPPSLRRLVRRVARALVPGGLFVFDLLVASAASPMSYRSWRAGPGWAVLVEVSEDRAAARLERDITIFQCRNARYLRSREHHALALHARGEVERILGEAGFTWRVSRAYGSFRLPPRRLVFWARKRASAE